MMIGIMFIILIIYLVASAAMSGIKDEDAYVFSAGCLMLIIIFSYHCYGYFEFRPVIKEEE